jgi:hypothetical protein
VGAARRTAPGNVQAVVVDAGGDSGSKTKRRGRSHTDKAAPAVDGWVPPVDGNVVGVLSIEEALVVSAHLRHLPLGTTVLWRLLSGSAVVAETTTQLFDSRDELLQGRRVFELHACDDGVARVPALRDSRAFLCVNALHVSRRPEGAAHARRASGLAQLRRLWPSLPSWRWASVPRRATTSGAR